VEEIRDSLRIDPGPLRGAEIETYGDHRIAMCFGMLGLRAPGIRLRNPACGRKTFPSPHISHYLAIGAIYDRKSFWRRASERIDLGTPVGLAAGESD
jgi:3-phosphoshikimate 1-carboxyvinyltransferase